VRYTTTFIDAHRPRTDRRAPTDARVNATADDASHRTAARRRTPTTPTDGRTNDEEDF
jgi:hypothetical protein